MPYQKIVYSGKKSNSDLITKGFPKPDIMLGNFNVVEDEIDRLPCKHNNTIVMESL